MRKIVSIISSSFFFFMLHESANAQSPHMNHTTIYVVDMNTSADFYEKAMMLQRIAEPFHDNRHIWERMGEHEQLHIVQGAKQVMPHDINIHLAFSVPSVENFAKHLDSLNIKYGNWAQSSKEPQVRPDGIKQIYLQDPDGYWIEVNDDKF
jgi:lactoylglutathione lyase